MKILGWIMMLIRYLPAAALFAIFVGLLLYGFSQYKFYKELPSEGKKVEISWLKDFSGKAVSNDNFFVVLQGNAKQTSFKELIQKPSTFILEEIDHNGRTITFKAFNFQKGLYASYVFSWSAKELTPFSVFNILGFPFLSFEIDKVDSATYRLKAVGIQKVKSFLFIIALAALLLFSIGLFGDIQDAADSLKVLIGKAYSRNEYLVIDDYSKINQMILKELLLREFFKAKKKRIESNEEAYDISYVKA